MDTGDVVQASLIGEIWIGKVYSESLGSLTSRLSKITDKTKLAGLSALKLKSPIVGLILGIFLGFFGVDRFYKGDTGLGIVKLVACSFLMFIALISMGFLGFMFFVALIWIIADFFLVWKGIKQDNFNKINNQLISCGV